MVKENILLSDEVEISQEDYLERKLLIEEFRNMPEEFFSKLSYLQPQVGCLNACKICVKHANQCLEFWSQKRLRNVIAALKVSAPKMSNNGAVITYARNERRNSVVFPYLDNDVGNYPYLDSFVGLLKKELGVKTRISTVSYSRFNKYLNHMHHYISRNSSEGLDGIRLYFTPYEKGWECKSQEFSKFDYILDISNFLKIYKSYFDESAIGNRDVCVELRYKPLLEITDVFVTEVLSHTVICVGKTMWISQKKNITFVESKIKDPDDTNINFTEKPRMFFSINLYSAVNGIEDVKQVAHKFIEENRLYEDYLVSEVYLMKNYDGIYYAIDPRMKDNGSFGINIYPKTEYRNVSGYIITEKFFSNALIAYRKNKGLSAAAEFPTATWHDVYGVLEICEKYANEYQKAGITIKSNYIRKEILPMLNAYISCLQEAGYAPKLVFDRRFSIDTGIICNMGRAITEFCGLTTKENEPLTPAHEKNYGIYNSKIVKEGVTWRLSCDYNNSLVIEKLNMSDTASSRGQVLFRKCIQFTNQTDEIYQVADLKDKYLIPGQRKIE